MSEQLGKKPGKRKSPSFIYAIISISLVLFLSGILSFLVVYAHEIGNYLRENIEVSVVLKQSVRDAEAIQLEKRIQAKPYAVSAAYVSPEAAAKEMQEQLGEDFLDLLGYNPLFGSINFNLTSAYSHPDSLAFVKEDLVRYREVSEVMIQEDLVYLMHENIRNVSFILAGIAFLLVIIAITLIDNTLRLSMFSSRFLIRSMQLVGATRWFIIKPFLAKALLNGIISSLLALLLIIGLIFYVYNQVPELSLVHNWLLSGLIFLLIFLLGVSISVISTFGAVMKYLRMRLDDLY